MTRGLLLSLFEFAWIVGSLTAHDFRLDAGFEGPPRILNVDGIQTKLDEIALPADWHWIETMEVVPNTPLVIEDVNQDLAREVKLSVPPPSCRCHVPT